MPFIQRCLEPIDVSRVTVEKGIDNELECVTNHTLSNIILQLSSLSKHAEDMFTELSQEVKTFTNRTFDLQSRMGRLRIDLTKLDPAGEQVSIHEVHTRKHYKSSIKHDQQVVSRATMPLCILKTYNRCDPIPAFNKLSQYREDGRDCVKFYTDPGYFFELWLEDIQKDLEIKRTEKAKRKKRTHTVKKENKKPRKVQTKAEKFEEMKHGVEFIQYVNPKELKAAIKKQTKKAWSEQIGVDQKTHGNVLSKQQNAQSSGSFSRKTSSRSNNEGYLKEYDTENDHTRDTQSSEFKLQPHSTDTSGTINVLSPSLSTRAQPFLKSNGSHLQYTRDNLPPPPPPPPPLADDEYELHKSKMKSSRLSTNYRPPSSLEDLDLPLPPPPEELLLIPPAPKAPPVPTNITNVKATGLEQPGSNVSVVSLTTEIESTIKPEATIGHSFLDQIKSGIHLRHLDDIMKRKAKETVKVYPSKLTSGGNFDVHSIMTRVFEERRKMIEESDEDDSSSDEDWD